MPAAGSFFRALLSSWRSYKYRFVPWIALNLARNRRTMRYVSEGSSDKMTSDSDVYTALLNLYRAYFISDLSRQSDLLHFLPEAAKSVYPPAKTSVCQRAQCSSDHEVTLSPDKILHASLGFCIDRAPSSLSSAGMGVFVSKGFVPKGAVVSMYPGTIYQKYEPIFFQSIGNPFIFRCLDGILIDGNDKRISKSVYRSCSRRDQLGPFKMCDSTWLTACPSNPLAVGQYVNNCSNEWAANVCYQEFDVPDHFPIELRQYFPNVNYSHDTEGLVFDVLTLLLL
ncbi:hypothetical protein FKM82_000245 [Ascaphus truei]